MAEMEITIIGQDGDYLLIADTTKGYKGRIHQSLVTDNGLEVVDGKINVSRTLYQAWFREDMERVERENQLTKNAEYTKTHANTYKIIMDFPINEKGERPTLMHHAENEEIAKAEAMELYREQFGEQAKGKIVNVIRFRSNREVIQFRKEKYGVPYPLKTDFGYLQWNHVPYFAMPYSPMGLREIPYLIINDTYIEKKNQINQQIQEHYGKRIRINGKLVRVFYSKIQKREYYKSHPEVREHLKEIEEWQEKLNELHSQLWSLRAETKPLTPEQLELLGINFDPYDHSEYQGGKAFIEFKGKRMEISPEYGRIL